MNSSEAETSGATDGPVERGSAGAAEWVPLLLNVEPRDVTRKQRTRAFRAAGCDVIEVASAAAALAVMRQRTPSAALIDVNLPDSNSVDLCATFKRLDPDLPVVLISRLGTSPDTREVSQPTLADACVCESLDTNELVHLTHGLLARAVTPCECRVWVVSDTVGFILDLSPDAAQLLNATKRGLQHRSLVVFFEHDRASWRSALVRACSGERVVQSGRLRPKERRPIAIWVEIAKATDWDRPALRWRFDIGDEERSRRTLSVRTCGPSL